MILSFGDFINLARRCRRITVESMAASVGVSRATYARIENGDPSVTVGAYIQTIFILGLRPQFEAFIDPKNDHVGVSLAHQQLKRRMRSKLSKASKSTKKG